MVTSDSDYNDSSGLWPPAITIVSSDGCLSFFVSLEWTPYTLLIRHLDGGHDHREHHQDPPPESVTKSSSSSDPVPVPVPVIDLHCLNDDVDDENTTDGEVLRKLDEACREWGIFRVVNHGVPMGLMAKVEELTKRLFWMSFESKKESCKGSALSCFLGTPALTPSGTALSEGHRKINLVEGFNLPSSQLLEFHPQLPLLQSFRELTTTSLL